MMRGFQSYHPLTIFSYLIGCFVLVMVNQHPDFLVAETLLLILYLIYLDHGDYFRQWGWMTGVFVLFFLLIEPLINHRGTHVLLYLGQNPVMLEAVIRGGMMAVTLLGLLVATQIFNRLITPDQFLFLFSRLFPRWALLMMLTLRFIPLFRFRLQEIEHTQRIKGLSLHSGSLRARYRSGAQLLQILLTWSLEEAIQTADSMVARAYGLKRRTYYHSYRFGIKNVTLLGISFILLGINLLGAWLGYSVLALSPILETVALHGNEWLFFSLDTLYFCLPLILDLKEEWLWRTLRQKA